MLITITINTVIITHTWKVSIKQKMYQSESQNNYYLSTMSMNIDDVNNILDKVIDQSFTRYQIMKLGYKDNLYITEEMQNNIIYELTKNVFDSLSDNIINKLSLIYKREYIDDIIVQKIQYIVLNYVIQINGNYTNKK